MTVRRPAALLAAALLALAACRSEGAAPAERPDASDPSDPSLRAAPALSGDLEQDRATLARLDSAAIALARADGCDSAGGCATIGIGERGCGGPRHYLVYCRRTTDEPRLRAQVEEIARFERAMNQRYEIASTCEFRMAPEVALVGGRCQAVMP